MRAWLILALASVCAAQEASDYAGTWVMKQNGQAVMKLTIAGASGAITASLVQPSEMQMDMDGTITRMGAEHAQSSLKGALRPGGLELSGDGQRFTMTSQGTDRALLSLDGPIAPWHLERVAAGAAVVLATKLPEPEYSPEMRELRTRLAAMVQEDQAARMAYDEAGIASADEKNRPEVLRIFERFGWVTRSLAGTEASHQFFLLVQHQTPEIQRRLLPAMEAAVKAGEASMSEYALLYDRVQTGLEKPQRWGTQTKCVDGKPVMLPVEDPAGLDARRKALFLAPMDEYLKMEYLVRSCAMRK
jgi:hypothetical protein